jgi:hypothetical protein
MIGKQITGRSFGGCIRYLVNRPEATILEAVGIRDQSAKEMIHDFNLQGQMNPNLGKAVGHFILSWSREDEPKLTPELMKERAEEYLEKMNIKDTQYLIVQHTDKAHPHLHIVFNRVDNNGKTISDKNNFKQNVKACKEITIKYGYHLGQGKDEVNRQQLRGKEKLRYQLYDQLKAATDRSTNWSELESNLKSRGISIQYKYKSGTKEVQGISFSNGNIQINGSDIDRSFFFAKLNNRLRSNQIEAVQRQVISHTSKQGTNHPTGQNFTGFNTHQNLIKALLAPDSAGAENTAMETSFRHRKKKRKHQRPSQ